MGRSECSDSFTSVTSELNNNSRGRITRTRQQIGIRSTEEIKRSDCEELTRFMRNILSVIINDNTA
jgi:hypothetical protein